MMEGQITVLNKILIISMHITSLVKRPCYLLKLSSGNENIGASRADNHKNDEICPLAIPDHIFLMSVHIASLVKIPCYLLKLSSGNKNMGVSRADLEGDRVVQRCHVYYVTGGPTDIGLQLGKACYPPSR